MPKVFGIAPGVILAAGSFVLAAFVLERLNVQVFRREEHPAGDAMRVLRGVLGAFAALFHSREPPHPSE